MQKRKLLCFLVVIVMVMTFMLTACSGNSGGETSEAPVESSEAPVESSEAPVESSEAPAESSEAPEAAGDFPREVSAAYGSKAVGDELSFGTILMNLQDEYFAYVEQGTRKFMEDTGFEVTLVDGASQPEKQVQGMESLIQKGVDGIELRCLDAAAMIDTIAMAKDAGIATAVYPIQAEGADIYMIYDDYQFGYVLAQEAVKWIKKNYPDEKPIKIAYQTMPENESVNSRTNGFTDCFNDELGPEGEAWELVNQGSGITADDGMKNAENFLQADPDIRVIIGVQDASGVGAMEATTSMGYTPETMWIGGVNADEGAVAAVADGTTFQCTIGNDYLPPEGSYVMLQLLANYVYGLEWDDLIVAALPITPENVDSYVREPFYDSGDPSPFEQAHPGFEFAVPAA